MQSWFVAFAAVTGVLSIFPYRERALLPVPSANEQGLLAQEISAQGTTDIVNDAIVGTARQLARDTIGSAGARRLIPAQIRGTDVPGASTLGNVLATTTDGLPGAAGTTTGAGPVDGNVATLAGVTGPQGSQNAAPGQGTTGANPLSAPQGPAVLAGAASQLLAAVVPEPSTWMMFVVGLMAVGHALRRRSGAALRRLQKV